MLLCIDPTHLKHLPLTVSAAFLSLFYSFGLLAFAAFAGTTVQDLMIPASTSSAWQRVKGFNTALIMEDEAAYGLIPSP